MGVGAHDIIGVEAKNLGFKRTLLMTTGLRGSGIIEELVGKIEYQGVEVVLYDKVESNPKDYNVMEPRLSTRRRSATRSSRSAVVRATTPPRALAS